MKTPIRGDEVHDGVRYVFPIEGWSKDDVLTYLKNINAYMPDYYEREETSRDCWDCTAYLAERQRQIAGLDPEKKEIVLKRLRRINEEIQRENYIPQILENENALRTDTDA